MNTSTINYTMDLAGLHARFESILPKIETHARISFRSVKCPQKKADRIAEVVALAWRWFVRLAEKGKDATQFPLVLADYAVRHVRQGRRLCGVLKPNDVLSERAQQERGFSVGKLPDYSTLTSSPLDKALVDNTQTPVPEQVAFRCDFPSWLTTRTGRDRCIITDMAMNERTNALSKKFGVSPGRISQLRRDFQDDWNRFCGELPPREACKETAA